MEIARSGCFQFYFVVFFQKNPLPRMDDVEPVNVESRKYQQQQQQQLQGKQVEVKGIVLFPLSSPRSLSLARSLSSFKLLAQILYRIRLDLFKVGRYYYVSSGGNRRGLFLAYSLFILKSLSLSPSLFGCVYSQENVLFSTDSQFSYYCKLASSTSAGA